MRSLSTAITMLMFACSLASAATIKNNDGVAYTLKVTEGGQQTEVGIAAGQSISACNGGCFITMPNGDREALSGAETVEINGGKATIK
jgi:hypothetical protein